MKNKTINYKPTTVPSEMEELIRLRRLKHKSAHSSPNFKLKINIRFIKARVNMNLLSNIQIWIFSCWQCTIRNLNFLKLQNKIAQNTGVIPIPVLRGNAPNTLLVCKFKSPSLTLCIALAPDTLLFSDKLHLLLPTHYAT